MFQGAGGHLGHRTGETGTATLGENHAVGPEGLGTAHDRTEVLGVGETVESDQEGSFRQLATALHQGGEIKALGCGGLEHDPLVHPAAADLAEAGPGDLLHEHPGGLGLAQQLQEAGAEAHLWGAPDAMHRPTALQGRQGGVPPPDQIGGDIGGVARGFAARLRANGIGEDGRP